MTRIRLTKSNTDRMIAGVCGGLAEHWNIDPVWVRLAFVALIFAGGVGLFAYIVLTIVVPSKEGASRATPLSDQPPSGSHGQGSGDIIFQAEVQRQAGRARLIFGGVLIVLGALLLAENLGLLRWFRWDLFWPLLLILAGIALAARRVGRGS